MIVLCSGFVWWVELLVVGLIVDVWTIGLLCSLVLLLVVVGVLFLWCGVDLLGAFGLVGFFRFC